MPPPLGWVRGRARQPLHGTEDAVDQIILGHPVAQGGRQKHGRGVVEGTFFWLKKVRPASKLPPIDAGEGRLEVRAWAVRWYVAVFS